MKPLLLCTLILILIPKLSYAEEEYSFDLSDIEKKPYSLGGYMEATPVLSGFDRDASLYKLKLYNRDEGKTSEEYNVTLQLDGSYEKGIAKAYTKINSSIQQSYLGRSDQTTILEGYLSITPSLSFNINLGKKTLKWGKGYAWAPVAFVDRTKNPDDPDLALEGFSSLSADYIKSYSGVLKTISFTPVLIPVYDDLNNEFGVINNINFACRLYLLLYDTDIDIIALTGGSKTTRFGFDFSRNLTTNFEMHGEFAFVRNFKKRFINNNGDVFNTTYNAKNYLLGIRYLTELDTTFIIEYYHNDTGFTENQMNDYFSFINQAYDTFSSTGSNTSLQQALAITEGNYDKVNPMRNYFYARISQKEPLNILYFTPSITGIFNINDESFSLSPEFLYTGITNLELRLKGSVLSGPRNSEYGEKQNAYKTELRMRYYF
jgi:hypothetical protein